MKVHNQDLFPPQTAKDLFTAVSPIISNPIVDDRFKAHEAAANRAKRDYHRRGRVAMLLVLVSALFTVAQALVIPRFPGLDFICIVFIVCGLVGLLIQIQLILTRQKEKWLTNRFAAERLRSIKFQAYALAINAVSTPALSQMANEFYKAQIARLDLELNAGTVALLNFSPSRSVVRTRAIGQAADATIYATGLDAYRELRVNYQRRFATAEAESLREEQRIGYTSADILYLLGAFLLVATLICKLSFPDYTAISNWIDFLGITSFIAVMMKAMVDNASLSEVTKARYENYVRALSECELELEREHASLVQLVESIEKVVLDELSQFCRSASQISYRL